MIRHPKSVSDTAYLGLFSGIESGTAERFIDTVCNKIPADTKTLYILFSNSGGSVSAGFVIYNFLRSLPYTIVMHNIGSVDSIGMVVFLAGARRYCTDNATFLMRRIAGDHADKDAAKEKLTCTMTEETKINETIVERSELTAKQLDRLFTQGKCELAAFARQKKIVHDIRACPFPQEHVYLVNGR